MAKVLPPTCLWMAIALAVALHFLYPAATILPFPWRWAGIVPAAIGIALNLVADRQFKRRGTTVKPFERSTALVTDGAFGISRNPMYLGMVMIVAGVAIFAGSATPWIAAAGLALLLDRVFIVPEEASLAASFGIDFQRYRQRVRRWI